MATILSPGSLVRHPEQPDWGVGHVQSVIGPRVTVNFEHAGKLMINTAVVSLVTIDPDDPSLLADDDRGGNSISGRG